MSGMNASTGRALGTDEHIRQSIRDILTTPVGSRVMRREYGSLVPDLIDHPGNAANRLRLMSATVMAILRWEPRVALSRASLAIYAAGNATIDMDGVRRGGQRAGEAFNLAIPLR